MEKLEEYMTKEGNPGGRPIFYHVALSGEDRENLLTLIQYSAEVS